MWTLPFVTVTWSNTVAVSGTVWFIWTLFDTLVIVFKSKPVPLLKSKSVSTDDNILDQTENSSKVALFTGIEPMNWLNRLGVDVVPPIPSIRSVASTLTKSVPFLYQTISLSLLAWVIVYIE